VQATVHDINYAEMQLKAEIGGLPPKTEKSAKNSIREKCRQSVKDSNAIYSDFSA